METAANNTNSHENSIGITHLITIDGETSYWDVVEVMRGVKVCGIFGDELGYTLTITTPKGGGVCSS